MNENKIEKLIKISDLKAKKDSEINRIAYENKYLVPCEINIKEEEVSFMYDSSDLQPLSQIKEKRSVEKLRIAINISNVLSIIDEYSFTLEPDNLYYDYNYNVKILNRDIRLEEEIIENKDILLQYKSLIGYLFNEKYLYNDFYNGGIDLIKANKKIEKYLLIDTIEEIRKELLQDLKKQEKYDKENYVEIKSRDFKIKKYSIRIMAMMIVVLMIYVVYVAAFLNPFNNNIIKANNYYVSQDYEGVIKCLEKTRGLKLDKESKYKLAYSYIISENLSDTQKKNIFTNLNEKSDENILDYWIALGKTKYDDAIDLAKKVQDNQLILYALLNKDKYIQDNNKLSGEEKQKQQETLKSEIDKLTKELSGNDTFEKSKSTSGNSTDASNQGTTESKDSGTGSKKESSDLNLVPSAN